MSFPTAPRFTFPATTATRKPRRTRAPRPRPGPEPDFSSEQIIESVIAGYVEYLDSFLATHRVARRGMLLAAEGFRAGYAFTIGSPQSPPPSPELAKAAARELHAALTHRARYGLSQTGCTPKAGWDYVDQVFIDLAERVMKYWHSHWPKRACAYSIPQVMNGLFVRHQVARLVAGQKVSASLGAELVEWKQYMRMMDWNKGQDDPSA